MTREDWKDWAEAIERPRLQREADERWRKTLEFLHRGAQNCSAEQLALMNVGAQQASAAQMARLNQMEWTGRPSSNYNLIAALFGLHG